MPLLEIDEARSATVGAMPVRRALPRRTRRTVGAWCFADHLGPAAVTGDQGLDIGPHPHIGLQTVTWLLDGSLTHRDSLGYEQQISPGQLNLMTSGGGIAHAEQSSGTYVGQLHGIQLWVALPEHTRHGSADFEHHEDLPQLALDRADVTVLLGAFDGQRSPARADTPLVGAELALRPGRTTLPLRADWEHALVVLDGAVLVRGDGGDRTVEPGALAYLGTERDELALEVREPTRAMLLGGEPFESPIVMWWNFVGRTHEEVVASREEWQAQIAGASTGPDVRPGRFGVVDGEPLPPIPAPALPNARLRGRGAATRSSPSAS